MWPLTSWYLAVLRIASSVGNKDAMLPLLRTLFLTVGARSAAALFTKGGCVLLGWGRGIIRAAAPFGPG